MKLTKEEIALAILAPLEGAHFYSAYLPSVMTIRKFAGDPEAVKALREGELYATGFSLALAGVVSLLIDNLLPILLTLAVDTGMILIYERSIAGIETTATERMVDESRIL